jgi:hypothetical protein
MHRWSVNDFLLPHLAGHADFVVDFVVDLLVDLVAHLVIPSEDVDCPRRTVHFHVGDG